LQFEKEIGMTNSFAITVLFLVILSGCKEGTKETPAASSKLIREIDKIKLTDLKGEPFSLKQYQGKTIFINFWATWCKPCINEMPSIQQAQDILKEENIIFLMASNESAQQIADFISGNGYKFNYVKIENSEEMNINALPATFIFDKEGKLSFSDTGERKWSDKKNIDLILKIAKQK
jgi:thiol-disulfide isomerase/thioredoxin